MNVFGFSGYSGSGKTTLIERVLPQLIGLGLRVSVIKHTHHDFDLDQPGKDSYRHRVAGAGEVLLASGQLIAVASDVAPPGKIPHIDLNDIERITELILKETQC